MTCDIGKHEWSTTIFVIGGDRVCRFIIGTAQKDNDAISDSLPLSALYVLPTHITTYPLLDRIHFAFNGLKLYKET